MRKWVLIPGPSDHTKHEPENPRFCHLRHRRRPQPPRPQGIRPGSLFPARSSAGEGTLKVGAQYAVGFDNINRADANQYKIPFTHTADVLTEATAEYAFFLMGALARKLWSAEHLTRENRWSYWHPSLPFLGDEVTGKTVA